MEIDFEHPISDTILLATLASHTVLLETPASHLTPFRVVYYNTYKTH